MSPCRGVLQPEDMSLGPTCHCPWQFLQQKLHRHHPLPIGLNEDINTNDTSTPPPGSIIQAHARQLNHQISSFLSSCPLYFDNGKTCTLVLLRNDGEDKKGSGFAWAGFGQQDRTNLWQWSRLHSDSDWDVQVLHGKLMKSSFKRIWPHEYTYSELGAVVIFVQNGFQSMVLCHSIFAQWAVYSVEPTWGAS